MAKIKKQKLNVDEKITGFMGSMPSIILHTILFIIFLTLPLFSNLTYESILLILTTIVSLEAIYLALFIQISINRQTQTLEEVSDDIEEIQEDVQDIQEDVEEVSKDVEEMQEDVEEINASVDEIEKDVEEISDDVEELQEDMEEQVKEELLEEEIEKTEDEKEEQRKNDQKMRLEKLENMLANILKEIGDLKK